MLFTDNMGSIYINNPHEYRVKEYVYNDVKGWQYDPEGESIAKFEDASKASAWIPLACGTDCPRRTYLCD